MSSIASSTIPQIYWTYSTGFTAGKTVPEGAITLPLEGLGNIEDDKSAEAIYKSAAALAISSGIIVKRAGNSQCVIPEYKPFTDIFIATGANASNPKVNDILENLRAFQKANNIALDKIPEKERAAAAQTRAADELEVARLTAESQARAARSPRSPTSPGLVAAYAAIARQTSAARIRARSASEAATGTSAPGSDGGSAFPLSPPSQAAGAAAMPPLDLAAGGAASMVAHVGGSKRARGDSDADGINSAGISSAASATGPSAAFIAAKAAAASAYASGSNTGASRFATMQATARNAAISAAQAAASATGASGSGQRQTATEAAITDALISRRRAGSQADAEEARDAGKDDSGIITRK